MQTDKKTEQTLRTLSRTKLDNKQIKDLQDSDRSSSLPLIHGKLIPKHLDIPRKKVLSYKKLKYQQSIQDKIQRNKKYMLDPLKDIEVIMKKFDDVIQTKKSLKSTPRKLSKKQQQMQKKNQTELEQRINGLLSLPSLKKIKDRASRIRIKTQGSAFTPQIVFSEGQRLAILNKYDNFIKNATKPNKRRVITLI